MRCKRPFPQVSLKSFEADLDSNRPEGRALGARSKEHVVGDVAERLSDDGPLGHVPVKGTLNADRFGIRPLLHRKLFESASDAPKPDRVLAENLLKLGAGKACELADRADSHSLNELGGLRPHAADLRDGERIREGNDLFRAEHLEAGRYREARRYLRE